MINSCMTLRSQGACASTSCRSSRLNVWAKAAAERTGTSASTVRILRYPNGQVRRLVYPSAKETNSGPSISNLDAFDSDDCWDIPALWQQRPQTKKRSSRTHAAGPAKEQLKADRRKQASELPTTVGALLEYLQSDAYREAQKALWTRVRGSYEILHGSPWVQAKPCYVLAYHEVGSEAGQTYTLRTRVQNKQLEDQMTQMLGRVRPDGSPVISVADLKDGVVTFEDEGDAERFACLLEADGHPQVFIARCDSHELFRTVHGTHGCVVLLRRGCSLPLPEQLATSLRGQQSLEDSLD